MLVGYPVTDWYQSDFLDLHIHPEDKHKMYCQERLQPGAQYDLTFRMLASDGRIVWFHNLISVNADDSEPSLLSGFMIDISERQRAEEVLQDLGGRLIEAQENERSRIARELHDDFNQRLALLSIELGQLGKTQTKHSVREACQKLQRQAQQLSADLHLLSYRLHPAKLDHLGLAAAVRSLCEELSTSTNLTIEFHQHGFPAVLSKEVALCIFRIAQEALRNCVKHSRAKSAQVFLWKTRGAVHVSISDDGCGFDSQSENTDRGLGFISMKERLHIVGGNIQISSQPRRGTCIKASVPTP
jgi:signal transduction histidine kinase